MKKNIEPLQPDHFYHIYNRGINGCNLFTKRDNYHYFLMKYKKYVNPVARTYAYCLLPNHFHFLICLRSAMEISKSIEFSDFIKRNSSMREHEQYEKHTAKLQSYISKRFATLFNAYSLAFNKQESRTGALFEKPFRRIEVKKDDYFSALISYIHRNPSKHGITSDFRNYTHSSYQSHLSEQATLLEREELLSWFGDKAAYIKFHNDQKAFPGSKDLLLD